MKPLNDPDLAPPHLRKDFGRLAKDSEQVPIKRVNCVVFDSEDDLRFWMGIIHNGAQGGSAKWIGTPNKKRGFSDRAEIVSRSPSSMRRNE